MKRIKKFNELFSYVGTITNRYVYHSSNPIFRNAISKEGLIVKNKSDVWLSNTKIDKACIFATNSDNKDDWFDSTYDDDIYQIDTSKLNNEWFIDPNFIESTDQHVITFENISLNAIKLIHIGSGLNHDNYNHI